MKVICKYTYCTSFPQDGGLLSAAATAWCLWCCRTSRDSGPGEPPGAQPPRAFLESTGPTPLCDPCGVHSISMQVALSLLHGTSERNPGPAAFPGKPGRRPRPWLWAHSS